MPFEDDLGAALRSAGDGFTADRDALADAGERRGRRMVARRRQAAAAGGSVLALALIATAGAYAGGLLDGTGGAGTVNVAAPPPTSPGSDDKGPLAGSGTVSAEQMIANLRGLLPGGQLTEPVGRGSDDQVPLVSGVYDDGKGKAAISLGLSRVDPDGSNARAATECGDKNLQEYDDCQTEKLADGSRLLLHKGYEYPDRRADTKVWRAVLVTRQGFQVELSEWNAPAEKGVPVSRSNPPLTTDQLKTVVTSAVWHPALNDLPAPEPEPSARPGSSTALRDQDAAKALEDLVAGLGIEIPISSKGGEGPYGYIVFDDGKGKSLVRLSLGRSDSGFAGLNQPPLPDGTLVNVKQGPAEKGKGVIEWTVDTVRTDGLRVVVSAFNTANTSGTATREQPVLTLDQLKEIALAPGWNRTRN